MNTLIARQFIIHRLNDSEITVLHAQERNKGYLMAPCWIHERFDTIAYGDVSEEKRRPYEKQIFAIYYEKEKDLFDEKNINEIEVMQQTDFACRREGVISSYLNNSANGNSLKSRINKGEQDDFQKRSAGE